MVWNVTAGGAAVVTAIATGSLSLIGFGVNAVVDSSVSALLAASLEAYGDSSFQTALYRSSGMYRAIAFLAGAASLVAYGLVVLPMKRFSAFAGGIALAVLMVPTLARSTEELVRLVPSALREASLALVRMMIQLLSSQFFAGNVKRPLKVAPACNWIVSPQLALFNAV